MHPLESGMGVPAFLAKLWRLVEDSSTNNLISWSTVNMTNFLFFPIIHLCLLVSIANWINWILSQSHLQHAKVMLPPAIREPHISKSHTMLDTQYFLLALINSNFVLFLKYFTSVGCNFARLFCVSVCLGMNRV